MGRSCPERQRAQNYNPAIQMLIGFELRGEHVSYIEVMNNTSRVEHERHFQDQRRAIVLSDAARQSRRKTRFVIINGFCKDVFLHLPMEFGS